MAKALSAAILIDDGEQVVHVDGLGQAPHARRRPQELIDRLVQRALEARRESWQGGGQPPSRAELVGAVDEATSGGALTTPLVHLLAAMGIGLIECHYMVARG